MFKVGDRAIVNNSAFSYHKAKVTITDVGLDSVSICLINGTNVYNRGHIIDLFLTEWLDVDKNTIVKEILNDL